MMLFIVIISILNTLLIIFFIKNQMKINKSILEYLESHEFDKKKTFKNKKHTDDMLKMREMYESD